MDQFEDDIFDWRRKSLNPDLRVPEYCYKCDAKMKDYGWITTPENYIICLKCGGYLEPQEEWEDD